MPRLAPKHDRLMTWLAPVAVAGLLAACGGGEKPSAGGSGTTSGSAPSAPPAAESRPAEAAEGPAESPAPAASAPAPSQAPAKPAEQSPSPAPAKAAAGGGGGGPTDPKLIALGDSIFHGQAGGGTCFACHAQDGKGSAVGANLTDGEWLHSDGSYEAIVKTIQNGVPKPTKAPAPMPPMGGASLSPDQVKAAAAYVYSLSHGGGKG